MRPTTLLVPVAVAIAMGAVLGQQAAIDSRSVLNARLGVAPQRLNRAQRRAQKRGA